MEILNQIGHLQHWGLTPAVNLLRLYPFQSHPKQPLRLLISGCADIRHILKTLCDINEHPPAERPSIQIYLHQTNKELLCRALLLLQIIHEINLNFNQRIELFLDLYGNAMIKQRNARYLHNLREDLLNLIHDEKKIATPLKKLINFKLLKFEERDQLSSIIQSWSMKVPLDMEKLRDTKLRYLYKERYDYRTNLIDWDYNMLLQEFAPLIHFYHYREWRLIGLAFQQRFSKYTEPNRTLASYAPGRKKEQKTSCLVRGYWGDIVMSPYIAFGTKCDYHQADLLFKKANQKYIGHSVEIAEYNLNYWLHRLQKQQKYTRIFRDYYRADENTRKKLEQQNLEKKKKKEQSGKLQEIKQEEIKQQEEQPEENLKEEDKPQIKQKQLQQEKAKSKKQVKGKKQVLDSDEEKQKERIDLINSKQINYKPQEKQILAGFASFNVSIHLMAMNSDKLMVSKFNQFFDVVCLGFTHSAYLTKGVSAILRKKGLLLVQKGTYLVPKKKEQRKELNTKLRTLIQENGFQEAGQEADLFPYFKN